MILQSAKSPGLWLISSFYWFCLDRLTLIFAIILKWLKGDDIDLFYYCVFTNEWSQYWRRGAITAVSARIGIVSWYPNLEEPAASRVGAAPPYPGPPSELVAADAALAQLRGGDPFPPGALKHQEGIWAVDLPIVLMDWHCLHQRHIQEVQRSQLPKNR